MASIDTSLAPTTSGAAAALAAAHSAPHPLKLYGAWFCPFVQRAWIVLAEKRIPHQYLEVNPYRKEPDFLALNPRGLVPTLAVPAPAPAPEGGPQDEDKAGAHKPLYESAVLCEYLDEAYSDEARFGPRLLPADDPYEHARCRLWMDHVGTRVVPAFYRLIQHTPDKSYTLAEARAQLLAAIAALVEEMAPAAGGGALGAGPYFLGDRFSLVDVMLAPWAKRLFLIDHYKPGGVGIEAAERKDPATWDRWRRWFDAVVGRASVRDTWSGDGQYIEAYRRYAEDTTQSMVGQATRQGDRLP